MKRLFPLSISFFSSLIAAIAQPASKVSPDTAPMREPKYVSESALPENWPAPGPYGLVAKKNYPASRAAFAAGSNEDSAFFTLFRHIKKEGIPMTAPVAMSLDEQSGKTEDMAFLYQSTKIGKSGKQGGKVTVKDLPQTSVLSYAWLGSDSAANLAIARTAIDEKIRDGKLKITGYRLLGYNSPLLSANKRTYEFQAVLADKEK